jgi:hypothetical protein
VCLSDGYLASVPTRTLLEKGLGKRAASDFVTRAERGEGELGQALEGFLARREAHAGTLGRRHQDRLRSEAVTTVLQHSRLDMEQENLLLPIEAQPAE